MPYLFRKKGIGIKKEATQGNAETLAATDFIHAYDVKITPMVELTPQNYVSTSLSSFHSLPGKKWYEIEATIPLKGSGVAGTELAPLGAIMEASGTLLTNTPATSNVYNRVSSPASGNYYGPGKSFTAKFYEDGILHVAAGCMVESLELSIKAGMPVGVKFKAKGKYAAVTDAAFPTITPNTTTDPPIVQSASFTIHSYIAIIEELSIKIANKLAMRDDVSSANSIMGFMIADTPEITGSINPESTLVATHDWWAKLMAGTLGGLSIQIGGTAGNIWTITGPKVQYTGVTPGERNGIFTQDVALKFCRNAGDDEIVFSNT